MGSRSVQVIRYFGNRRTIMKHIGTGNTDEEVASLKEVARLYIEEVSRQTMLFTDSASQPDDKVTLSQCEYLGFHYGFLYEVLKTIQVQIGYTTVTDALLTDLAIIRIVDTASKLRSVELMETYFGIRHRRQRYYESAPQWLSLKDIIEEQTLRFRKQ